MRWWGLACHGNSVLHTTPHHTTPLLAPLLALPSCPLSDQSCLPWTTSQHLFLRFGLGWLSCHLSGIQGCHMKLACPSEPCAVPCYGPPRRTVLMAPLDLLDGDGGILMSFAN
ncbi:hypothetical protein BDA96_04G295700 [Sorghum bicolor]|uniref:Uncharacterized protein n=1 Tax=Sorghum bicolor TaxID=4558 RepID=A0A921R615_SORBI|nr:hypothetical protein BDA96_04G295700 [Sorghum bicolor]